MCCNHPSEVREAIHSSHLGGCAEEAFDEPYQPYRVPAS
jgi:hypothetical protein